MVKRRKHMRPIHLPCMAQTFRSVRFDQLTILVGKMQFSLSHSQLLVMAWV
jgi:hypothetical protein